MQPRPKAEFETFDVQEVRKPNYLLIALIVVNIIAFIATMFINAASSLVSLKIFDVPTGNISDKYPVEITPAGWTFSTWGIIYTWQALWLLFNLSLIFIRNKNGRGKLYNSPCILTPVFHLIILSNFGFNIGWLFIWAEEMFSLGFAFLVLIVLTLYFALFITHRNIYRYEKDLDRNLIVLWLYRILVNNGLAFYATWVTIAANLNMAIAYTYEWNKLNPPNPSTPSIVAVSVVALVIVIYFIMDIGIFEKYLRHTYSPYIQMAIAFAGVLSKNWDPKKTSSIMVLCLAVAGPGVMLLVKISLAIYRCLRPTSRTKF